VGRVLPGAGGQRAGSDGAEHDGEDERGQGDGEGDDCGESLIPKTSFGFKTKKHIKFDINYNGKLAVLCPIFL